MALLFTSKLPISTLSSERGVLCSKFSASATTPEKAFWEPILVPSFVF